MKRRRIMRTVVGVAAALGVLLGMPGVAVAKTTVTNGFTYVSWRSCAWTQAWLSDEWGAPGLQSVGTQDWTNGVSQCGNSTFVAEAWAIALKQNVMIWFSNQPNGNNGWIICETGAPWVQNPGPSHDVWTGFSWARPPCGAGFYRSWSNAMSWDAPTGGWHSAGAIWGNDWVIAQ